MLKALWKGAVIQEQKTRHTVSSERLEMFQNLKIHPLVLGRL